MFGRSGTKATAPPFSVWLAPYWCLLVTDYACVWLNWLLLGITSHEYSHKVKLSKRVIFRLFVAWRLICPRMACIYLGLNLPAP